MAEQQILPENRVVGQQAQLRSIAVAKSVSNCLRTTLGPRGMDKMILDPMGDFIVTNDGVTIMQELKVEDPIAKMLVEVSKSQELKVGDGTTTAVVLACELLKNSESLIFEGIHPTIISHGYNFACNQAIKILDKYTITIEPEDTDKLLNIATTAMTGKSSEYSRDLLARLVVDAVTSMPVDFDKNNLKIKALNGPVEDSNVIKGVILPKERSHPDMPAKVENAKILLVDFGIELRQPEGEHKYEVTDVCQLQQFAEDEDRLVNEMLDTIFAAKPDVVICQANISDFALYKLAKAGIFAVKRIKRTTMERLSKAINTKIVSDIKDVKPDMLSEPCTVEERTYSDDKLTFITGCKNPESVTILLFGSTDQVVDELKRAMEDAIGDIRCVLKNKKIVPGAGFIEAVISKELTDGEYQVTGRERLAIEMFAKSLETIPKTLAESAGLDPIDTLPELKMDKDSGVDVVNKKLTKIDELNVYEPYSVKQNAIKTATEAAIRILRIDDIMAGERKGN